MKSGNVLAIGSMVMFSLWCSSSCSPNWLVLLIITNNSVSSFCCCCGGAKQKLRHYKVCSRWIGDLNAWTIQRLWLEKHTKAAKTKAIWRNPNANENIRGKIIIMMWIRRRRRRRRNTNKNKGEEISYSTMLLGHGYSVIRETSNLYWFDLKCVQHTNKIETIIIW